MTTQKLITFLKDHRVHNSDDDTHTHSAWGDFSGKFNIEPNDHKQFVKLYKNVVKLPEYKLTLCEKQGEYSKLIVDIDLKSGNVTDTESRLYNDELVEYIGKKYIKSIKHYLNITDNKKLMCLYFEKPNPTIDKNIKKDGFHFMFPRIITDKKTRQMIRQRVLDTIKESYFTAYDETLHTTSPKDIIDDVCSKNWLLYGSAKPNGAAYKITAAYDHKMEQVDFDGNLVDLTSLYNIDQDEALDIKYNGPPTINTPPPSPSPTPLGTNNNKPSSITPDGLRFIFNNIDESRWDNHKDWITLHMICINEQLDYDVFDEASKKSDKYDAKNNAKELRNIKIKKTGYTEKTLFKMLKEDNPDAYKEYLFKFGGLQRVEINENKSYDFIKSNFEKSHFKIMRPIMFGELLNDGTLYLRSEEELVKAYKNLLFDEIDPKINMLVKSSFINAWKQDEFMRTYDYIDFLPMQEAPSNVYNTFTGYAASKLPIIEGVKFEDSLMYKHIMNLSNNEIKSFEYVIKILARKIQKPYKLTNTGLIFRSKQGAGKDICFNWIGNNIIGSSYYFNTEKTDYIFGRFNSNLENKILVVMNETKAKDTHQIIENIKVGITADYNIIEHKGKTAYKNTNNTQYIYLTNNNNPMPIDSNDRRFCGFDCNNQICRDFEYFKALLDEIKTKKYDRAFYDYLMGIDCDDYDFDKNRPITEFYKDMQEANVPVLARFMQDVASNQYENQYSGSKFYTTFLEFIEKYKYKIEMNNTVFGIQAKNYPGIKKSLSNGTTKYTINHDELKAYLTKEYKMEFSNNDSIDNGVLNHTLDGDDDSQRLLTCTCCNNKQYFTHTELNTSRLICKKCKQVRCFK